MREASDKLQLFIASIGSLAGEESKKAKLLFVRNQIADYEAECDNARTFGFVQILFAIFPLFWPILLAQRHGMVTSAKQTYRHIQNALDVWKSDLGDEHPRLVDELARIHTRSPRLLPWGKRA
jgi:hypothetical protein